jgi:two-component system NtrC family sensor kinase
MKLAGGALRRLTRGLSPRAGGDSGEVGPLPQRPRRGLTWPLRGLLTAALAIPLLLLALAAWQNYRLLQAQTEQRVTIEANELREHGAATLQTYALALGWVQNRIAGLSWDQIERDEGLHRFLSELESLPQIEAVLLVDPAGRVRASGHVVSAAAADASRLDAFVAQKAGQPETFVGRERSDPDNHLAVFDLSRRRRAPDGSFDGAVIVSAKLEYFTKFFSTVSENEKYSALLVRNDGSVLVRYPPLADALTFGAERPVMRAIAAAPERGVFRGRGGTDGVERIFSYRRIDGYPLYVAFGVPNRGVLEAWRDNLVDYLWFAVPAALALFCMTWFAVRQLQRYKIASWRWRATARRLRREMSRRESAEAELRQAQKMEALGQLTGGVAHDFNNLLTVLQGCLELLSGEQRSERLQSRVEMALRAVERGERLTRQLLAFARRQPLTIATVDINAELRRMSDLLTQTVGSEIKVRMELALDLWPVDIDATQLELAIINLVINARDAMPEGGVLRVRTFNTTLSGTVPGEPAEAEDFAAIAISDTGAGMAPEVAARAFEPFFTTKGHGKGTGLGLSMVYGFAHQSGGTATIRSQVGRGTTVTLHLPRSLGIRKRDAAEATGLPQASRA